MSSTTHQVRQRPPLRALVLAAGLLLVGIVFLLMADLLNRQPALTALGVVGVVLGLVLFAAAWLLARSMRVEIVLDDDGYRLVGPVNADHGSWGDIGKVTLGASRITLHRKDGSRVLLVVSRGGRADLEALGQDIASRLDADRGYTTH